MKSIDEWDDRIETEVARAALQTLESELEQHMAAGNKGSAARCLHAMADVYGNNLYEIQKQNELLMKSLDLYKQSKDENGVIRLYRELLLCSNLLDVGATYREICQIYKGRNDIENLIYALREWAGTYKSKRQNDSEKKVLLELVKVYEDNQMDDKLIWIYRRISVLTEDLDEKNKYLDRIPKLRVLEEKRQLAPLQNVDIDRYAKSRIHECMARKYEEEGDFRNALATFQTIIDLFETDRTKVVWPVSHGDGRVTEFEPKNEAHIAHMHMKMARIHGKMGDIDTALALYKKALGIHDDEHEFVEIELNKSEIYAEMGKLELGRKNYAGAVEYLRVACENHDTHDMEPGFNEPERNLLLARQMLNWAEKYSKKEGE